MDRLADIGCVRAHLDRQTDFADQVAGIQTDDAAADDAMRYFVEDELGEAFVATVGDRATRSGPREQALPYLMPSALH
jgi:chromosome condensin MukBEF ATPase and DNA-binding subunit MukB